MTSANIGAIDAGSNAIRVVVARVIPGSEPETLRAYRVPVRLGHGAFTVGELDIHTIDAAVEAFHGFREVFDEYEVTHYRAVATSAVRNSRNRDILLHRLFAETHIQLEVITGAEEARLIRKAMRNAFRDKPAPMTVLDLGGGSLEVNVRNVSRWNAASLPIGTVRLIETFGLHGIINSDEARMVRRYVATLLEVFAPDRKGRSYQPAAAAGGNAEQFAKMLGSNEDGLRFFEVSALEGLIPSILESDVRTRQSLWSVRKDRAEVMGVAGLALATCARELHIDRLYVPGVGLRDALLYELAATLPDIKADASAARDKALLTASRMFAARVGHDITHGEKVRELATSMFDQLHELHELPIKLRTVLATAALLHDVGEVIHGRSHHKHSEYMIRWGRIVGLDAQQRLMVAALVRAHRKSLPNERKHPSFAELDALGRAQVMKMLSLLRVADALDTTHRQRIKSVKARQTKDGIRLELLVAGGKNSNATGSKAVAASSPVDTDTLLRKSALFEQLFDTTLRVELH